MTATLLGPHTPTVNSFAQWRTLSGRGIGQIVRNGEFIIAVISPAFLAVCFYLPLRSMMDQLVNGMNYGAFLMPIIALQSVGFVASSAAMRSAIDRSKGINTRFRVLPMNSAIPALARLSTNIVLLIISLIFALLASFIIGWRPNGGVSGTFGLLAVALCVGLIVALLGDAVGLLASSPEATSQMMSLPILILGMISTGFVPETQFPEWIRGFARDQPVSKFAGAMRAFNDGTATWQTIAPAIWWCVGLGIFSLGLWLLGNWKATR